MKWLKKLHNLIFFERNLRTNPHNQKSLNFDLISRRNHQMNIGEISENKNHEIPKLRMKLTQIMILKLNLKLYKD